MRIILARSVVFICILWTVVVSIATASAQPPETKKNEEVKKPVADEEDPIAKLFGKWKALDTNPKGLYYKAEFNIQSATKSEVKGPNATAFLGQSFVKLDIQGYDEEKKLYRIRVEYVWDSPSAGGSGPRKGILRIDDKGNLEWLEAKSSVEDYPVDFSAESKDRGINHNKFSRPKPDESDTKGSDKPTSK